MLSVLNILKPIVLILVLTLISFEYVTPELERFAKGVKYKNQEFTNKTEWLQKNNILANYSVGDRFGSNLKLYVLGEERKLQSIVEAKSFEIQEKKWKLNQAFDSITKKEFEEYYWYEAPNVGLNENLGIKELPLSHVYKILSQTGPEREKKKISYEFWKKLLEPLSAISIILLSIALSISLFARNKNLERVLFGALMAFGFNLVLKIFGNVAIINNISPSLAILIPSLLVGYIGLKILKT